MDINAIPSGTDCLIDANIVIYFLTNASPDCVNFFDRIAQQDLAGYLTTTIVAEILHRRMMMEAQAKGLVTPGRALAKLKAQPSLILQLTDYITEITKFLRLPLDVLEVNLTDIAVSHSIRTSHGLFVNDSLNLAYAQRYGITNVVSRDTDVKRVPTVIVWEPTDI